MPMTNAERQARHRRRTKARLAAAENILAAGPSQRTEPTIDHEVRFCGTRIWPRDKFLDELGGATVTERDVIVAWYLIQHRTADAARSSRAITIEGRDLVRALSRASSLVGVGRVMDDCFNAYGRVDADLSDMTPPGTLEMIDAADQETG